ncbi:MAG: class I mannose-6-phosphate isomerase [Treponemataceae bacterium]|nr:class I mannose-6-phosphate isomerase [Treponemataceae bacterium]
MKNEQKLFMLKPFVSKKIWGCEQWILSTMKDASSFFYEKQKQISINTLFNSPFPLLIKTIEAEETLSVQVHPDNEYALKNEHEAGKTECWYILDAEPDSVIVTGLKGIYTKEELLLAIKENRIESYLSETVVKKGDLVFIPAGTVHAIKGGLKLLEIQQPSDITYRLYDWGRNREVHVEKALDVAKNYFSEPLQSFNGVFECDYFSIEKCEANCTKNTYDTNSWTTLFIIEGSGSFECNDEKVEAVKGNSILAAPNSKLKASGNCSFLKICPK